MIGRSCSSGCAVFLSGLIIPPEFVSKLSMLLAPLTNFEIKCINRYCRPAELTGNKSSRTVSFGITAECLHGPPIFVLVNVVSAIQLVVSLDKLVNFF